MDIGLNLWPKSLFIVLNSLLFAKNIHALMNEKKGILGDLKNENINYRLNAL